LSSPNIRYPAFELAGYPAETVSGASVHTVFHLQTISIISYTGICLSEFEHNLNAGPVARPFRQGNKKKTA
jgi:hypothetical protein